MQITRILESLIVPGLLILSMTAGGTAAADPPPDDVCAGAVHVDQSINWFDGSLTGYSNDYDPAVPGPSCTGLPAAGKDMVFSIDLNCSGGVYVLYRPSDYDGAIYAVTDCSDITGTCVAGVDEYGMGGSEELYVPQPSGFETYYIILDAKDADAGGDFSVILVWGQGEPTGACCFADGHCEHLWMWYCDGVDFHWCIDCDPNPCEPTPTDPMHWGRIKQLFR